ncbi:hypothetical protein AN958_06853 [Leucoagaricus sp. SymC.cos]|nr:hypothetical protein AN958_06853 [Leucoagaricus sp. SymC.cos]
MVYLTTRHCRIPSTTPPKPAFPSLLHLITPLFLHLLTPVHLNPNNIRSTTPKTRIQNHHRYRNNQKSKSDIRPN